MDSRHRAPTLTITFTAICMMWTTWGAIPEAAAIPLTPGRYAITTGAMSGTFSIGFAGEFSSWNLTFPMVDRVEPSREFKSPDPAPIFNGLFETTVPSRRNVIRFSTPIRTASLFETQRRGPIPGTDLRYLSQASFTTFGGLQTFSRQDRGEIIRVGPLIPEPSTWALFATGLLGLAGYRWHQRRCERTQVG